MDALRKDLRSTPRFCDASTVNDQVNLVGGRTLFIINLLEKCGLAFLLGSCAGESCEALNSQQWEAIAFAARLHEGRDNLFPSTLGTARIDHCEG